MSLVVLKNVVKEYGKNKVLRGVTLTLESQGLYVMRGASGSGKSTLLYLMGGLDRPTLGEVIIGDKNLSKLSEEQLALYRNQTVGFVFQFHFLLPSMNCVDNILLPARIAQTDESKVRTWITKLAERLEVKHCLEKYPHELSGGEQQRVNIVRALSLRPKLLLCDEPTGNLDSKNSERVTDLLKELALEYQATLLVVTHDDKVASHFQHKITIEDGQIIR